MRVGLFLTWLGELSDLPPSDIELNRVDGVHGPHRLHNVCLSIQGQR